MQFNKYNKYKDGANVNITGSSSSSSNNNTVEEYPSRSGGGSSKTRVIWGQEDDGNDIKESMKVEGNIYIIATDNTPEDDGNTDEEKDGWTENPDDDEEFDFDWDEDTEGGSLYVENKVKAKTIEATEDVTVGGHLFVKTPHPDHNGEKVCILDYIKSLILPVGSIIMYNGSSTLPDGWFVCNGQNGTPDLRGKFIKASDTAGTTGGNNKITLSPSQLPSHRHSVTLTPTDWFVMSKKMQLSEFVVDKGGSSNYCLYTGENGGANYDTIGSVSGYTDYEGTNVGSTGETIDIQPEFYSLIFIMKVR